MEANNQNKKKTNSHTALFIPALLIAIMLILFGIYMIVNDLVMTGRNWRTLQPTAKGGEVYLIFGFVFLVVAYFNLSPFSRLRQYFEGRTRSQKTNRKG